MKYLIATIAFLFLLSAKGQGRLHNLFEELPNDSIAHNSVQSHTSLKPRIDYSPSVEKKIAVHALADINGIYDTTHSLRSGLGLNLDWTPNQKWHIRLAALQGYGLGSAVLQPKSFLRFNDSDGYAYTDIRSRISYTTNRFFNFQAGLDHNFLGEGCR